MYIGVKVISFSLDKQLILKDLAWPLNGSSNYSSRLSHFLSEVIQDDNLKRHTFFLIEQILENVHDHGSGNCVLSFGIMNNLKIFEIFEEKGGFDLINLPHGRGGCGFRAMQQSLFQVSHSSDGRSTYVVIPSLLSKSSKL